MVVLVGRVRVGRVLVGVGLLLVWLLVVWWGWLLLRWLLAWRSLWFVGVFNGLCIRLLFERIDA